MFKFSYFNKLSNFALYTSFLLRYYNLFVFLNLSRVESDIIKTSFYTAKIFVAILKISLIICDTFKIYIGSIFPY